MVVVGGEGGESIVITELGHHTESLSRKETKKQV